MVTVTDVCTELSLTIKSGGASVSTWSIALNGWLRSEVQADLHPKKDYALHSMELWESDLLGFVSWKSSSWAAHSFELRWANSRAKMWQTMSDEFEPARGQHRQSCFSGVRIRGFLHYLRNLRWWIFTFNVYWALLATYHVKQCETLPDRVFLLLDGQISRLDRVI